MSRKDDLLKQISELSGKQAMQEIDVMMLGPKAAAAKQMKTDLEKTLAAIRKQFEEASEAYSTVREELSDKERALKAAKLEEAALRRELSRELDAEAINTRYLEEVEAFRQRCLEAPWRKENRSDGIGAKHHQIEGAIHLAISQKAILGDKLGLGKSLTSIIYSDFVMSERSILVTQSDLMGNIIREIQLWAPHRQAIQLGHMTRGQRDNVIHILKSVPAFTLVINYEAWRHDPLLIPKLNELDIDTLIMDEAHNFKNVTSDAFIGVKALAFANNYCACGAPDIEPCKRNEVHTFCRNCDQHGLVSEFSTVKNVLPMTGTPILNKPQEFFPMLHIVDPENFPSERTFLFDFCRKDTFSGHWGWKTGGIPTLLKKVGPRFLARDKTMAGIELPPAAETKHVLPKEEFMAKYPKQYEAYEQVRKYAQLVMDPDSESVMAIGERITVLLRLRQVLTWPAAIELKVKDKEGNYLMSEYLDVHESWKVDRAEELLKEFVEGGERCMLFSQFKAPLHVLQERLGPRAVVYDGTTSHSDKQLIQLDFDQRTAPAKPRWDIALVNYKAGGAGLNFTGASQTVIMDREWNPGKEDQAKGRTNRMGQTRSTGVDFLHVESSVDTWLDDLHEEKLDIINGFQNEQQIMQSLYDAIRDGEV